MKLPPGHGAVAVSYGGFGRAMLEKLGWSRHAPPRVVRSRCALVR
jgi:hypothetical protein